MTKKRKDSKRLKDPFAKREAGKYEHPVPSREVLMTFCKESDKPVKWDEFVEAFSLASEEELEGLRRRLIAMERDGQLIRNRKKGYAVVENLGLVRGYVLGHKDGFGFLRPDDGGKDLFIPAHEMRQVFDGDKVLVRVTDLGARGRKEVTIIDVLERNTSRIVGRLIFEKGAFLIIPDNPKITQDILILPENLNNAKEGQIVIAELITAPSKRSIPLGKVVEVLGEHKAPGLEIDIAIHAYGLPNVWPEDVLEAVKKIKPTVAAKDKKDRLDLRDIDLVTIDGEDAKDFDDAVYCEKLSSGWRLYVAIADVAHYVAIDSELDKEAQLRGNSVYFPERVIPMLPEILSNGLCSLNPEVDRLCMVCIIDLKKNGDVKSYDFEEALMCSKARLTYNQVADMLVHGNESLKNQFSHVRENLENLYALFKILHQKRASRGAIEFEIPETQVVFNRERKIEKIVPRTRNDAHRLIEECMLIANVCTANYLLKNKMPALYRNHPGPDPDKMLELREFLNELGLSLPGGNEPSPKDFARVLEQVMGRPDANMLQTVLLRSLSQAVYQATNEGHFGLAYSAYTHFTSPIRRYPDLLVHRSLKHLIHQKNKRDYHYKHSDMEKLGVHCSMTERRADEATRSAMDWLKCEYMLDKLGQEFDGFITGVTAFGVFVSLNDIFVEGLVHITSLKDDYYQFDPKRHQLLGQRGGMHYQLGDPIRISVVRVDLQNRKIDFELAGEMQQEPAPAPKKKKRKKS